MAKPLEATPRDTSAESSTGLHRDEGDTPVVVEVDIPPDAHTLAELFGLAAEECQTIAQRTAEKRGKMPLMEWRRAFGTTVMATRAVVGATLMKLAKNLPGADLKHHSAEVEKTLRALEVYQAEIRAAVRAGLTAEEADGEGAATERTKLDAAADRLADLKREMEKAQRVMLAIDDVQRTEAERDAMLSERRTGSSANDEVPDFTVSLGIEVTEPATANPPPRRETPEKTPPTEKPAKGRRGWWPFGRKK